MPGFTFDERRGLRRLIDSETRRRQRPTEAELRADDLARLVTAFADADGPLGRREVERLLPAARLRVALRHGLARGDIVRDRVGRRVFFRLPR